MENHFVRRFTRLFPSSFTSCNFRHVQDTVESSIVCTKSTQNLHTNEDLSFPRIQAYSSLIKPQKPKNPKNDTEGKKCSPAKPVSTLNARQKDRAKMLKIKNSSSSNGGWFSSEDNEVDLKTDTFFSLSLVSSTSFRLKTGETFLEKLDNKSTNVGRCPSEVSVRSICPTQTDQLSQSTRQNYLKTTKNGRGNTNHSEKTTKSCRNEMVHGEFVKESAVPEASNDHYGNCRQKTTKTSKKIRSNRRRSRNLNSEVGWCSIVVDGRVEESYAVEKITSDPYSEFRISMVEMILEKQIFKNEDLVTLLHCFISLNSACHHKVIHEVFSEICETLFNN